MNDDPRIELAAPGFAGDRFWTKLRRYAALAYFILPLDVIPDIVPGIGYTDDLGMLVMALLAVSAYVHTDIKVRAHQKTLEWFGDA